MDSKRQWSLLTALACVAVLVAGFILLVQPEKAKAQNLSTQAQDVRSQTQQLRVQLATLQEQSRKLASEQVKLDHVVQQLPPGPQLPDLTRQLDKVARDSHIDLLNIAPGPEFRTIHSNSHNAGQTEWRCQSKHHNAREWGGSVNGGYSRKRSVDRPGRPHRQR